MKGLTCIVTVAFLGAVASAVPAQEPPQQPEESAESHKDFPETEPEAEQEEEPEQGPESDPELAPPPARFTGNLTGDWWGLRSTLQDAGFELNVFSNTYFGLNFKGGENTTNANRLSTSYDIMVRLDFEKMELIPGGEFFMFAQGWYGVNVNDKVGAIGDPFDDADGNKSIWIDQMWYQQNFFDRKVQFRFGYLDQQSIIDRNAYANSEDKQFMNTLLDNNNAIIPLTIGQGASLFVQATEWWGLELGIADSEGRPFRDGFDTAWHGDAHFFTYFQTDFKLTLPSPTGPLPGTYRLGTFYDPRTKVVYASQARPRPDDFESDDYGFYLSFDQMLYREETGSDQGLGVFARYGFRHGDVNQIEQFWSVGTQYLGLLPQREKDVVGFGVYSLHASHDYQRYVDDTFSRETGFEFYYRIQVAPWLTLTPDFQVIVQPGGSRDAEDAIVGGLRARITF